MCPLVPQHVFKAVMKPQWLCDSANDSAAIITWQRQRSYSLNKTLEVRWSSHGSAIRLTHLHTYQTWNICKRFIFQGWIQAVRTDCVSVLLSGGNASKLPWKAWHSSSPSANWAILSMGFVFYFISLLISFFFAIEMQTYFTSISMILVLWIYWPIMSNHISHNSSKKIWKKSSFIYCLKVICYLS